jgi:hypothetical protein
MRGKSHEHKHAAHMKHHRAKGGRIKVDDVEAYEGGGDPAVEKEAEEKKRGGRAKKAKGGHVEGHKPKHHLGRKAPGRKRGGRVGADMSPLSSAHRTTGPEPQPKTEEGGLSK